MINWFTTRGIPDMSQEVASITTSLLAFSVVFIAFGVFSYMVVKYYSEKRSSDNDDWERQDEESPRDIFKNLTTNIEIIKDHIVNDNLPFKVKGKIHPITGEEK